MSDQLPVVGGEGGMIPVESPGVSIAALGNGRSRVRLVIDDSHGLGPIIAVQAIIALVAVGEFFALAAVGAFFLFAPLGIIFGVLFFLSFRMYTGRFSRRIVEVTCPEGDAPYVRQFLLERPIKLHGDDAAIEIHREISRWFSSPANSFTVRVASYQVDGSYMRELRAVESSSDTLSLERVDRASDYVELLPVAVLSPSVDEVASFARRRGDVPGKDVARSLLKLHGLIASLSLEQVQRLDILMREFMEVANEWNELSNGPYESTEEAERLVECFELLRLPVEELEGEFLWERRGRIESRAHRLSEKYGSLEGNVLASSDAQGRVVEIVGKDGGE